MIPDLNMGKELYYEHINRYQFAGGFVKKKKVLDLACGSGYGSKMLSSAGANNVVGLDISKTAIEYAENKYWHANINFFFGIMRGGFKNKKPNNIIGPGGRKHLAAVSATAG